MHLGSRKFLETRKIDANGLQSSAQELSGPVRLRLCRVEKG